MLSFLVVVVAASLSSGMGQKMGMDMGMDMHTHHRCCQHDMWHGMLHMTEGMLKNGSTMPEVYQVRRIYPSDNGIRNTFVKASSPFCVYLNQSTFHLPYLTF